MGIPNEVTALSGSIFNTVNPHCLQHIVDLSDQHEVVAESDIYDEKGNKLWAKGLPVTADLRERLLRRRLARPLEVSLDVREGLRSEEILKDALSLMGENPFFSSISGNSECRSLLKDGLSLALPGPVKLLLTSARVRQQNSYRHSLGVMVVAAGLASRLKLSSHEGMMVVLAALVHDLGEFYVDPSYIHSGARLRPHEWKFVAAHPTVGHAFLQEFTALPKPLVEGVLHHHERLDGSGYPLQVKGDAIGRLARVLAVADTTAAIALQPVPGLRTRLEVAFRIVPEEYDRNVVAVVDQAAQRLGDEPSQSLPVSLLETITALIQQLECTQERAEKILEAPASSEIEAATRYVLGVLTNLEKSLRATGVRSPDLLAATLADPEVAKEVALIAREIGWRLRNLARNLHLRLEKKGLVKDLEAVAELIEALDGEPLRQTR